RGLAFGNFTYNNVVFAGYGIVDAEAKINDFNGLDVKGKIVLVVDGAPEGYKPSAGSGRRFVPASTNGKIISARNAGAAGVFVVTTD
ncbi:PA domain-containing protein, partial [Staphylococcus aureus]